MSSYPFVVSLAALKSIKELELSYEEVLKIPKEFDRGGCHTFLLKSDIVSYLQEIDKPRGISKKKHKK